MALRQRLAEGRESAMWSMFKAGRGSINMKVQNRLSAGGLLKLLRSGFERIEDHRVAELVKVSLTDTSMSAFAMFSLKDPSLLAFDKRRRTDGNLKRVYDLERVPCDTQMRTTLDEVEPSTVKALFKDVFGELEQDKVLEKYVFLEGSYLLSLDGTGYFSSKKIHCDSCLERVNKKTGEVTYHHQLLGAAIVHPDAKVVIPFASEPIIKQDGETKNDCERNAAKRFFEQLRQDHPELPLIVTEDALRACENIVFLVSKEHWSQVFRTHVLPLCPFLM